MERNHVKMISSTRKTQLISGEEMEIMRRGPWTVEEDLLLIHYIQNNGEGRWNFLARSSGLSRTGKSCRLRWLNYLRPDVRRGNITPQEQLLILDLHSRWGNRWSKIAQLLPGRTDNEIKNYWRTRVQKHAKQLRCDVDSKKFKDVMRYLWMPRLVERILATGSSSGKCAPLPVGQGEPCPEETSPDLLMYSNSSTNIANYSFQDCEISSSSTDEIIQFGGNNFDGWSDVAMSPQGGYFNHGLMMMDEEGNYWEDEMGENLWNLEGGW